MGLLFRCSPWKSTLGLPGPTVGTLFLPGAESEPVESDWEVADVRRATCCIAMVIPAPRSASRRPDHGIETADPIDDRESALPIGGKLLYLAGRNTTAERYALQPPEMPASSLNVGRLASQSLPQAGSIRLAGSDSTAEIKWKLSAESWVSDRIGMCASASVITCGAADLAWCNKSRCGSAATEAVAPPMPAYRMATVASIDATISPG